MINLFSLTFYSYPNEDYAEGFFIGLFHTHEEAETIAQMYRREVTGFKDYNCDTVIREVPVIGNVTCLTKVFRYIGWNTNEDFDEVDIIESDCFASKEEEEAALARAKTETPREEWVLDEYLIGQCDWQEGFVRATPEDVDP